MNTKITKLMVVVAVLAMVLSIFVVAIGSDDVSADATGREAKGLSTTAYASGVEGIAFYVADGFTLSEFEDGVASLSGTAANNSYLDWENTWGRTNGYSTIDVNLNGAVGDYQYIWFHVISTGLSVSAADAFTCAVGETAANERIKSWEVATFNVDDYIHDMCFLVPQDGSDISIKIYGSSLESAGRTNPEVDGATNVTADKATIAADENITLIASFTIETADAITKVDLNSDANASVGKEGYPYMYPDIDPEKDVKFNDNYKEWAYNAITKTLSGTIGSNVIFDGKDIVAGGSLKDNDMKSAGLIVKRTQNNASLYYSHVSGAVSTVTEYDTYAESTAATAKYVITLLDNDDEVSKIQAGAGTTNKYVNITIDLNGKTLTQSEKTDAGVADKTKLIYVNINQTFVIKNGTVKSELGYDSTTTGKPIPATLIQSYGQLILGDGTGNDDTIIDTSGVHLNSESTRGDVLVALMIASGTTDVRSDVKINAGSNVALYANYGAGSLSTQNRTSGSGQAADLTQKVQVNMDGVTVIGTLGTSAYVHNMTEGDTVLIGARITVKDMSLPSKVVVCDPIVYSSTEDYPTIGVDGVYGDITIAGTVILPADSTLTVNKRSSLTINGNGKLVNNGTIDNDGTISDNGTIINNGTLDLGNNKIVIGDGATLNIGSTGKVEKGTISFLAQTGSNIATLSVEDGGVLGYFSASDDRYVKENDGITTIVSYDFTTNGSAITAQDVTGAFKLAVDSDNAIAITGAVNAVPTTTGFNSVPRLGVYGVAAECANNVEATDLTIASGVYVFARGIEVIGDVTINGIIFNEESGTDLDKGLIIADGGVLTIGESGALRGYASHLTTDNGYDFIVGMPGTPGQTGGSNTSAAYEDIIKSAGYGGFTISFDYDVAYIEGSPVVGESITSSDRPLYLYEVTVGYNGLAIGSNCEVKVLEDKVLDAAGGITLKGILDVAVVDGDVALVGSIDVYEGAVFSCNDTVLIGNGGVVELDDGHVSITAFDVGGAVAYVLTGEAAIDETGFFKSGDSITVAKESVLNVDNMVIPAGVKITVNGELSIPEGNKVTIIGNGTIDLKGSITDGGEIFFGDATVETVVLKVAKGATVTAVLNGTPSVDPAGSYKVTLTNISGGEGGFTVTKGSVYINGALATPVDGVISVTDTDVVYISGSLEEGVTLNVAATAAVEVATGSTLTLESGAQLVGKISFSDASSAVIYEKGSKVNGATIKVTTKETSSGTEVKVTITLVSQDGNKLVINGATTVEVFTDDTYGDALKDVVVIPAKKFITFDGWYLLANNEKVSMSQDVLDYDHVLTACFTDERGSPITPDDSSSSETHYIPLSDNGDQIDIALPAAFVMLILSIFVLGFVVVKKRK